MTTPTFTETLQAEVATLQAQHPILAGALGKAFTLVVNRRRLPPGRWPLGPCAAARATRPCRIWSMVIAIAKPRSTPHGALCAPAGVSRVSADSRAADRRSERNAGSRSRILSRRPPTASPAHYLATIQGAAVRALRGPSRHGPRARPRGTRDHGRHRDHGLCRVPEHRPVAGWPGLYRYRGRESDQREEAFGTPLCQNGGDQGFRPRTQAGLKY